MIQRLNAPQWISLMRIFMAPLALIYLYDLPNKKWYFLALVLIMGFTDWVDGQIARSQNQTTYLGAILDYTADKIFIITALIVLSVADELPLWITLVILYREILVMGMRIFATHHHFKIEAGTLGKLKTAFTFAAIIFRILQYDFSDSLFYIAVFLTIASFYVYLKKFNVLVKEHADSAE